MRLDKLVASKFPRFSRTTVQKMIERGLVLVNGVVAGKNSSIQDGDCKITFRKPVVRSKKDRLARHAGVDKIKILYEDKECMVVNKPAGMIVHPGSSEDEQMTVVNAVISKLARNFEDKLRPGVVHRLDRDTSGVLVMAKNPLAAKEIMGQFKSRKVHKIYSALVLGVLQHTEGIIDSPIARSVRHRKKMSLSKEGGGRNAISKYKTLNVFRVHAKYQVSLLEVEIMTGRTHQIRVHMAALGHPVVGDFVYGNRTINKFFETKFALRRQFLHASKICFNSPATKKEITVEAPLAEDLSKVLGLISEL